MPLPPARTTALALRAAVQKGNSAVSLRFTNGQIEEVQIEEVMDDALMCRRVGYANKVCLIYNHDISWIEVG